MQTALDDQTGTPFEPPAPSHGTKVRSWDHVEDTLSAAATGALAALLFTLIPMLWTAAAWATGMRPQAPAVVLATSLTWSAIGAGLAYAAGRFDKSAQMAAITALAIAAVVVFPIRPEALMGSAAAADSPLALAITVTQTAGIPLAALTAALWMLTASRTAVSRWSVASGVLALAAYPLILEPAATLVTQAHVWTIAFAIVAIVATASTARSRLKPHDDDGSLDRRTVAFLLLHTAVTTIALVTIMTELAGPLTPLALPASGLVAMTIAATILPVRFGTGQAVALPLPSPSFLALTALVLAVLALPDGSRYRLPAAVAALCVGAALHARQVRRIGRSAGARGRWAGLLGLALGALIGVVVDLSRPVPPLELALILMVCTSPSIAASVRSAHRLAGVFLLSLAAALVLPIASSSLGGFGRIAFAAALVAAAIPIVRRTQDWPERNLVAAAGLLTVAALFPAMTKTIHAERTAWAPLRIVEERAGRPQYRLVSASHTIAHHPSSETAPLARLFDVVRNQKRNDPALDASGETPLLIGIVGIEGTPTCATAAADVVRYFSIDATTARLATDARWFPNFAQCTPTARIVTGDPRTTLAAEPDEAFDVLVVDASAFPSPVFHLLDATRLSSLIGKIAPAGMLVIRAPAGPVSITPWLSHHLTAMPGMQSATVGDDLVVATRNAQIATTIAAWPETDGIDPRTGTAQPHFVDLPAALRHAHGSPR